MSDKNLMRVLRAVRELDVRDAPKHHRLMTPECPSLPRFVHAWHDGSWTVEELSHTKSGCGYCELMGQMLERHPEIDDWFDLVLQVLHDHKKKWTEEEVLEASYDPSHIDTEQLYGYCKNMLDEDARREVEAHVARCDFCTHQLAGLIEVLPPPHPQHSELVQFASGELDKDKREWVEEHLAIPCAECIATIDALRA